MVKGKYQIPFKGDSLLHYTDCYHKDVIWKDNYEFLDELEYIEYSRGRSSTIFYFKSKKDSKSYSMFISDFNKVVSKMTNGIIVGRFTFVKKGSNYGVQMIEE